MSQVIMRVERTGRYGNKVTQHKLYPSWGRMMTAKRKIEEAEPGVVVRTFEEVPCERANLFDQTEETDW